MEAFRRGRAGVGLNGKQVGDRFGGGRKFEVRSVDDIRRHRAAASHVNGLGAVMRFLAAGVAGRARLGAAEVLGARQFIAGVIEHLIGTHLRRGVGTEAVNLPRKNYQDEQYEQLHEERHDHAPIRHESVRSLTGQPRTRA